MSSITPPTARELSLAAFLLFALVILSGTGSIQSHSKISSDEDPTLFPHLKDSYVSESESLYEYGSNRIGLTLPQTTVVAHVPGWTIFDRLYVLNGTVFIVSDEQDKVPDRSTMISSSLPIKNGPVAIASRLPTDRQMRIVSTDEAKEIFGMTASRVEGVTWWANDPSQFITHYYHWSAELFFGFWRTYSSMDPSIPPNGTTLLPPPRRMIFSHVDAAHWRDYAAMNQWVLRSAFPSISTEFSTDWADRAALARPFVFDRVVLADRSAAMYAYNYLRTQRTASVPFALPGSAHWWSTIRNSVIEFSGFPDNIQPHDNPVITYISRQGWGRRMLIQEHHEKLVEELYKLRDNYGYEVNVVSMDKLSRVEQLQLAGRSTIMMGVHGNGLTSLVWMKPTPRSTVMEFFFPGGFAHDYEWTTRALGMVHFGFWGDRAFTRPNVPNVNYPAGFQGNEIPIDGTLVARLCHERLILSEETDD